MPLGAAEAHQRVDAKRLNLAPLDQLGAAKAGGWARELPVDQLIRIVALRPSHRERNVRVMIMKR